LSACSPAPSASSLASLVGALENEVVGALACSFCRSLASLVGALEKEVVGARSFCPLVGVACWRRLLASLVCVACWCRLLARNQKWRTRTTHPPTLPLPSSPSHSLFLHNPPSDYATPPYSPAALGHLPGGGAVPTGPRRSGRELSDLSKERMMRCGSSVVYSPLSAACASRGC
jgi:hypothetical protein